MEMYEHWQEYPTARTVLRQIAIGLGILEPTVAAGSTPPEDIAIAISNPKTFAGGVFGIEQLPEWMKTSLAMTNFPSVN